MNVEMIEKFEAQDELAELSEVELEEVSGGTLYPLFVKTNIAVVNQANVAIGSFANQSNSAVVIQG